MERELLSQDVWRNEHWKSEVAGEAKEIHGRLDGGLISRTFCSGQGTGPYPSSLHTTGPVRMTAEGEDGLGSRGRKLWDCATRARGLSRGEEVPSLALV